MRRYAVSKTALLGLTKALAEERAGQQRVNCVCPGIVPTKVRPSLPAAAFGRRCMRAFLQQLALSHVRQQDVLHK